ncbi:MAG TPA: NeuD/PglB/VioB family sugar acetyltransferase [Phycisphaerae bacterium]|nr:NeuD/PglB/VioB family sugar acetyltransferase [Phycisphaerae bacterium]
MTKKLIILGTGGNCIDILDAVNEINRSRGQRVYECVGFLDDDEEAWGREVHGVRVLGGLDAARRHDECLFVNGIGSPLNFWRKRDILARTQLPRDRFETIVHPSASVSAMSRLGRGAVVLQNATVASHAALGDHVIVLPNSVISHNGAIGDYTCIAAGVSVSGDVVVGSSCYLGANSAIRGNVRIGDDCLVGMGSVVLADVAPNSVVVGNPARFLRKTRDQEAQP